jgi:hypothetical protein
MSADPHGMFSPSVYETGRLVRYAPSLRGHAQRVRFLLHEQRGDGRWGGHDEYALVPTLSATEALLSVLGSPGGENGSAIRRDELISSVGRGLHALFGRLNTGEQSPLPDTVGVEILVPGLIAEINGYLAPEPPSGLEEWRGRRLAHHSGTNDHLLNGLRAALIQGHALPKLLHSLEVFGDAAQGAPFIEPVEGGVGCSPAATAVWLGDAVMGTRGHPSVRYLEVVQARGGGPVPVGAPLPVFERAWVLSTLAAVRLVPPVQHDLVRSLHAAFGEFGVAAGSGLPPDADDTATALTALARLGSPRSPDCLWAYLEPDGHFACFFDERTASSTTNAHVLQALGACLRPCSRHVPAMRRLTAWLCDIQEADGSWRDKWHASAYYATACCALALAEHGGDRAGDPLRKAVRWILSTQRPDGSWGRWAGTCEETAYAVQVLSRSQGANDLIDRAVAKGCLRLLRGDSDPHPALWHDKDLYTPVRIVRAERLAALHLATANPRVAALLAEQNV